ncbi:MAG: Re/Si-specific NAD(P)(+) transhydrogenase subunit alpha [Terriglobales bacterium]
MIVGVPRETVAGERRVALVPDLVPKLAKAGLEVSVESGAGTAAGFLDPVYAAKGARVESDAFAPADVLLKVQPPTLEEIGRMKPGAVLISFLRPYDNEAAIQALAARNITAFSMELMPRITRAQPMDALSAMSTIAGYKAVLIAAGNLPKFFPLLMTAAGTMTPAKVFIIGAGVAGLQAIGTARRLGAVVEAYDTRPAVKEQVESLGGKFAELALETKDAEDKSGYAKGQSEEFYRKQQEMMGKHVMAADVVIPTALVPGQRAPVLITEEMVRGMRPGSVIVDLAAEQGGNCEASQAGSEVVLHAVRVIAPLNLAATIPHHASQLYAKNLANFVQNMTKQGELQTGADDEIVRDSMLTRGGEVVAARVREALGMAPLQVPVPA